MNPLNFDAPRAAPFDFRLPVASNFAAESDHLMIALLVVTMAVLVLVVTLMITFAVRYRAGSPLDRGKLPEKTWRLETAWTAATILAFFGLFYWGADLYVREFTPPANAVKIDVVGKQWMWKFEHPGGQREINTLHVPTGVPIQLLMTSADVIHDVDIPAFRLKHDVLPGRYQTLWFIAEVPGTYDLFCAQLCGADHSLMRGFVVVMAPAQFQKWLAINGTSEGLVAEGKRLFEQFGCAGCHGGNGTVRAPPLVGIYNSPVPLSNGAIVTADDKYLHDKILYPNKEGVVASYKPIMPSFAGKISEDDVEKLVAYLKSLGAEPD